MGYSFAISYFIMEERTGLKSERGVPDGGKRVFICTGLFQWNLVIHPILDRLCTGNEKFVQIVISTEGELMRDGARYHKVSREK